LLTRLGLIAWYTPEIDTSIKVLSSTFLTGWLYDSVFYLYASIPFILLLWLTPEKLWQKKSFQWLINIWLLISIYILCFIVVSEFIFWDEFQVRFNFISVDYLVYRKEVMDNIQESYPVLSILMALIPATLMVYVLFKKGVNHAVTIKSSLLQRSMVAVSLFALLGSVFTLVDQSQRTSFTNNFNKELASNGPYQFFSAFRNNELEYSEFYQKIDISKADKYSSSTARG